MQRDVIPDEGQLPFVEVAIQKERLLRYMAAAGRDKRMAFALYMWNCSLCEAFVVSLHFSEIVCRNAIHRRLISRLGAEWFENNTFLNLLDERYRRDLGRTFRDEAAQHGAAFTSHHLVSALTFGFWQHLLTKRFERLLWSQGIQTSFPNAPKRIQREHLYLLVESVRRWRNRIAHHGAVFDRGPTRKHQDALKLIAWTCLETAEWVASISKVPRTVALRPPVAG